MIATKNAMSRPRFLVNLFAVIVAVTLVGAGAAGAGIPAGSTLVLHLPFDDGTGSAIAADLTGNGHHGTLVNMDPDTDWVPGQAGFALDFDGTDDYVSVPDDAALDFGTGDFSVTVWYYKRSATTQWDNNYGVSKWYTGASPGHNEWCLLVGSGGQTGDDPGLTVETAEDGFYGVDDPQEESLNVWHHLIGVRRDESLSLYVDGILVARNSSLPADSAINNAGRHLLVAVNSPSGPHVFYTDGLFDDVQIYDFALSDGDVAVGQVAGGDIAFLYANPGLSLSVFGDGFESGDASRWSDTVP